LVWLLVSTDQGGNVTGVTTFSHAISAKRLEFLHQLVPNLPVIALLVNPSNPSARTEVEELQAAAHALSVQTAVFNARTANDIDVAFAVLVQQQVGALIAIADPLFTTQRLQLVTLAARHAIATMSSLRELVEAGGLMSYGASFADVHRHAGIYAARILKGEKPTDLPVELPTQFVLVINLKTAKRLGLDVPPKLLALADEVIE